MHEWDRQPGETAKQHRAFLQYRDLGPDRSIAAAVAKLPGRTKAGTKSARPWERWSAKFNWIERAQAWDRHEEKIRDAARERTIQSEERKWALRRAEVPIYEYKAATVLLTTAVNQVERKGTLTNVSAVIETASRLMRRACKMPTEIEEQPPDNFRDLFFESSGEIAASMPTTAVPEMPADVGQKPRINTGRAEAGKDESPRQPAKPK